MNVPLVSQLEFNRNVNMNHNEEVPDFLGEFLRPDGSKRPEVERGNMLPADVLKKVNELLEQLHQADKDHHGSTINLTYVAPGAQYVNRIDTQIFGADKSQKPKPASSSTNEPPQLPEPLATDEAMVLWERAQKAGWVDENFQPKISRTKAAMMAHVMATKLGIRNKWKVFETLWHRQNMYQDYYDAVNQQQSIEFGDSLTSVFG